MAYREVEGTRSAVLPLAGTDRLQRHVTHTEPYNSWADIDQPARTARASDRPGTPAARIDRHSLAGRQSILHLQRTYGNRFVQRMLAPSRSADGSGEVTQGVESAIERSRGGGQGLDSRTRTQMESAFGADFSDVRIHTGPEAHSLNCEVEAHAFTTGADVFFRDGAYDPQSTSGKELLAHELTHVVQQTGTSNLRRKVMGVEVQRLCSACEEDKKAVQPRLTVSQPDDPHELEAESVGRAVTANLAGDALTPLGKDLDDGSIGDQCRPLMPCRDLQRQDAGSSAAPAACAHPVNFTLGAAVNNGADGIRIPIRWSSSTGDLADLSNCTIREVVRYDAIPNPPFLWNPPNPTILTVAGSDGAAQDTHSYPPGLLNGITNPRQSGTMVAHQVYQSRCTGAGCSGNWETLPGQTYTITRRVFPAGGPVGPWQYSITKTGVRNGSRTVEIPAPAAAP